MDDSPCSLPPGDLNQRADEWRALAGALLGRERTTEGARLRYRVDPVVAEKLLALIEAERGCCPQVSFTAELTLDVRAPEETRRWVADAFVPLSDSPA